MRVTRPLMLLFALAIVAGGCAQQPVLGIQMAAAPAPQGIDNVIYGAAGAPAYAAPAAPAYAMAAAPAYAAPAPSYAMAGAPAYGMAAAPNYPPMAAPGYGAAPMAAAYPGGMMPAQPVAYAPGGYAPGGYAPGAYAPAMPQWSYTLDSGDRLRVVVFGQDGLTNSYVVDASGDIAMPLIGSVVARGLTTDQLSQRLSERRCRDRGLPAVLHSRRGQPAGPIPVRRQHDGGNRSRDRRRLWAARRAQVGHHQPQLQQRPDHAFPHADHRANPARRHHPGSGAVVLTFLPR
jgi:hypothetical protein